MTDALESLANTYREQLDSMKKNLSNQMKESFRTFFENNPDVEGLAWVQFTPYFNDGDECIFSVNDIYPATKEQVEQLREGEIDTYNLDPWEFKYNKKEVPEYYKHAEEFTKVLRTVDDSIFKAAFGDHCRVIATRDGFDVEEYEHD